MLTSNSRSVRLELEPELHEQPRIDLTTLKPQARVTTPAPKSVILVALAAAIAGTVWSWRTDSMLLYGDARAHLNVSRHVVDGLRPGLSQLGSVWLPVPHLLMVPFVALRPLWRTGLAGAIVGGACYTYASVRIFTLVRELTGRQVAAWCAFALFAANANMLYVQSTALTEPVLMALLIGATYHIVVWMRTFSVRSLAYAAVFTLLATLTRYEGWAFLLAGTAVVLAWSLHADRRKRSPEANAVLYLLLGSYGIVLWLIYNLTIFGDAFYFLRSQYSALAINGGQAKFGALPTKGSLVESALTYGWDAFTVVGPLFAMTAIVAAAVVALQPHPERRRSVFALFLLVTPALFEIVSLFAGQTTIRVPQRSAGGIWNVRYGLLFLPFCAVAIGLLVNRRRVLGKAAACMGAIALVAMVFSTPLVLQDGQRGTSSAAAGRPELAAAYLREHYEGGRVLADDSGTSAFMFAADLDLREFVSPGFHPYWEYALVAPHRNVSWVVASRGDGVADDIAKHPGRFRQFRLVMREGPLELYRRIDD